jgi:hypothetical protein
MFYSSRNNASIASTSVAVTKIPTKSNDERDSMPKTFHRSQSHTVSRSRRHQTDKRLHSSLTTPSQPMPQPLSTTALTPTAPIRLPKSHIHRTPSELQLAQERLKADYYDGRMYARLVYGMSHAQYDNEDAMHPLTVKSLRSVVNTHHQDSKKYGSYSPERDVEQLDDSETTYQDPACTDDKPAMATCASSSSMVSNSDDEEEDECVFSLDM